MEAGGDGTRRDEAGFRLGKRCRLVGDYYADTNATPVPGQCAKQPTPRHARTK
jgi:hypothetical protein